MQEIYDPETSPLNDQPNLVRELLDGIWEAPATSFPTAFNQDSPPIRNLLRFLGDYFYRGDNKFPDEKAQMAAAQAVLLYKYVLTADL